MVRICQVRAEGCYQKASMDAQMASIVRFQIIPRKGLMADFHFLCHWKMITLEWAIHSFIPGRCFTLLKRCLFSTSNKTKWLGQNTKLPNWNEESYNSVFYPVSAYTKPWHDCQWWVLHFSVSVCLTFQPIASSDKAAFAVHPKTPRVILS